MESEMTLSEAVEAVTEALREDEDYRRSWQANIAMAFQDEYARAQSKDLIHEIANRAATYFLSSLCHEGGEQEFKLLKNLYEKTPG